MIWAIDDHPTDDVLNPTGNSHDVSEQLDYRTDSEILVDAGTQTYVDYAQQFGKLLRGYGNEKTLQQMQQHSRRIVVAIFDAATSGRLSVTFYRELSKDEYIENVLQWHEDSAWYLTCFDNKNSASAGDEVPRRSKKATDKPKPILYIGAPSFADIINCVYSTDDHSSDSYRRFAKYVKNNSWSACLTTRVFPHRSCSRLSTRSLGHRPMTTYPSGNMIWRSPAACGKSITSIKTKNFL